MGKTGLKLTQKKLTELFLTVPATVAQVGGGNRLFGGGQLRIMRLAQARLSLGARVAMSRSRFTLRVETLAAARDLIQEEGYEGLTLRRLARRMECSPMALYSYNDFGIR
jgi:hypothetical protein